MSVNSVTIYEKIKIWQYSRKILIAFQTNKSKLICLVGLGHTFSKLAVIMVEENK